MFFVQSEDQKIATNNEEHEEALFDCMASLLELYVLPAKGHPDLYPLCATALSVFAFLMTLLPSHWVHNLFTE